ncbi:adenylate/guanylate cyclase domain-containing protein [Ruegeria atlantica]|uniref:Invasion protein regulator n=1 Tax=Ruegeria atlantica TaxID=81569 RepID=A0A0P1F1M9_9RHOB|nr:adenylate/guanylate cyclase domain-containing protein [Ruegeria atlantica]CUH47162.1 invasion protein regulator [Ruegeria atlantica]
MERRLTAIVAADVVGYSRLIREDETGTLASIKSHREDLIEPIVSARKGRIVKLMGDGLLIEFASAVEAVQCAIEIQHFIGVTNKDVPEKNRIHYRIGINVGDIVVEGDDIYGDGVNVAARLEGLAVPDGIYMATNVFDQIKDKLDLSIEDLGLHEVKNIAEPIRVFSLLLDDKATALVTTITRPVAPARRSWLVAVVIAVAVVVGGMVLWQSWKASNQSSGTTDLTAAPLTGKPSIAVLAFDNLNSDPEHDYLSDSFSENIITALSRFVDFFVISRNSTFTYKDQPVKVQQVAEELGVRYVVEGSVQILGDKLRVTAQLIDATNGKHLWAENYDRSLEDIFAVQDEVTRTIALTLNENIDLAEYGRLEHQPTDNLNAYELFKRAQEQAFTFTKEGNILAMELSEKAIELDPNFASAYIELAWAHNFGYRWGWTEIASREESLALAFEMARKAIKLEPFNFKAHQVLASVTVQSGDLEKASSLYEKAISLNPNSAQVLADSIDPLIYSGRADEAVDRMRVAIRLNPHHPDWYLWNLGWAQYFAEDYEGALASIEKMNGVPDRLRRTLAPILLRLGREDEARAMIGEFLIDNPDYDIEEAKAAPFTDKEFHNRWLDDLRALGVPENAL